MDFINYQFNIKEIIEKTIQSFSSITDIIFINQKLDILSNSTDIKAFQDLIRLEPNLKNKYIYAYPLIFNYGLEGIFILFDEEKIAAENLYLYRGYLEVAVKTFLKDHNQEVLLLKPLYIKNLRKILNFIVEYRLLQKNDNNHPKNPHHLSNQSNNNDTTLDIIKLARQYILENITSELSLKKVAQTLYISPDYLSRIFKEHLHINFIDYINMNKVAVAQRELLSDNAPIKYLSQKLGFSQSSYFSKVFKQKTHLSPLQFRKQNSRIKKIYTIPRDLTWNHHISVYDISKKFFADNNIDFKIHNINGYPYVYSINYLKNNQINGGWIYTVDFLQPIKTSNEIFVNDKTIIQWLYTDRALE